MDNKEFVKDTEGTPDTEVFTQHAIFLITMMNHTGCRQYTEKYLLTPLAFCRGLRVRARFGVNLRSAVDKGPVL